MRISQAAAEAEVNIQTIRLYERIGLLKEPGRTSSGYRDYDSAAVETIQFIRSSKELGFTLREIKQLLEMRNARSIASGELGRLARIKIAEIDQRISRLEKMRNGLVHRLENCSCRGRVEACLLLGARKGEQ